MKQILINLSITLGMTALFSIVFACQPAKTDEPVVVSNDSYAVIKRSCEETCLALVKSGNTEIYVEYALDNGSIEFLDIDEVLQDGKEINAYIDSSEISKINDSILKSSVI